MAHTLLLFQAATSVGGWIENNFMIVPLTIGFVVYIIRQEGALRRVVERLDHMEAAYNDLDKETRQHTTDTDRHVNHLHMRAMEHRIDKIDSRMDKMEITMSQGFEKTLSRIDTLIRRD